MYHNSIRGSDKITACTSPENVDDIEQHLWSRKLPRPPLLRILHTRGCNYLRLVMLLKLILSQQKSSHRPYEHPSSL